MSQLPCHHVTIFRANKAQHQIGTLESLCYPVRSIEISQGKVATAGVTGQHTKPCTKQSKGKSSGDYALRQALILIACLESIRLLCVVFCSGRHTRVPIESPAVITHGRVDNLECRRTEWCSGLTLLSAACQFRRMTPATTTHLDSRE